MTVISYRQEREEGKKKGVGRRRKSAARSFGEKERGWKKVRGEKKRAQQAAFLKKVVKN